MATQFNTLTDLGAVTKIPNKYIDDIFEKLTLCIGSEIHDALLRQEKSLVLGIGIGTLSIDLVDMQCKFIPSRSLKAVIKKSLTEKIDPLEEALEEALVQKLEAIYKEVF